MNSNTDSSNDPIQGEIAAVLGRTPSGVYILTAGDQSGHETGMLASWVQQASFSPPMVSVAVNQKRYLNEWLKTSPKIVLNLVGANQVQFLKHFGRGFEPDEPAFEGIKLSRGSTGLPILADALGYLEGPIAGQTEAGDHIIYLMEIESAGCGPNLESEKPMVHIRKNGFNY